MGRSATRPRPRRLAHRATAGMTGISMDGKEAGVDGVVEGERQACSSPYPYPYPYTHEGGSGT